MKYQDNHIMKVCKNSKIHKKSIIKCMRNGDYQMVIPKLNTSSFIVVIINEICEWKSFLHCYIIEQSTLIFATGYTKKEYRRQGLSTKLRLYVINEYKTVIQKFESLTMPDSHSKTLLEKIGFKKENNKMVKYC